MKKFVPTRSIATVVVGLAVAIQFALVVMLPFGSVRPPTVGFVALIVTGVGMLLRERVFPATRSDSSDSYRGVRSTIPHGAP